MASILNIQIVNAPSQQVLGKRAREDVMVDVSKPIPYPPTPEVVEALRLRILQLENELRASKKQKTAVQTMLPGAPAPAALKASGSGLSGAVAKDAKAEAKIIKTRTKSLFDQVKKAAKNEKYQNVMRTVKVEDHFSQADFELVFGSSGTLIQPTASNKPNSNVWIRQYSNEGDFQALFGDSYKSDQLKGFQWSRGSIHVGKGRKLGQVQLKLHSIELQWSKNTEKATLKCEISEVDMSEWGCAYDEW